MSDIEYTPDLQSQIDIDNKAYDTKIISNEPSNIHINLELIDTTIIKYLSDVISPQITVNGEVQKVEVMYADQERWNSIQKLGFLRDERTDKALTPSIVIRRSKIDRNNLTNPSNKYLYQSFTAEWNERNTYDRFAVQNNIKPSRKYRQVIVPDYISIVYDVLLWTEYQTEMNQLIEQVNVENDEYWGVRNNYKFRIKIDSFNNESEVRQDDIRYIKTNFKINAQAYLVPEKVINKFKPVSTIQDRYTVKKVVFNVESTGSL